MSQILYCSFQLRLLGNIAAVVRRLDYRLSTLHESIAYVSRIIQEPLDHQVPAEGSAAVEDRESASVVAAASAVWPTVSAVDVARHEAEVKHIRDLVGWL